MRDTAESTETASFTYDDLDRMTGVSGAFSESFTLHDERDR